MVQDINEPLAAGEQTSVWIMPRAGVEAGEYKDTITYTTEEGTEVSFNADMVVAAADDQTPAEEPTTDPTPTEEPSADNQIPTEEPAEPTPEVPQNQRFRMIRRLKQQMKQSRTTL